MTLVAESGWDSVGGFVQQNRSWFALITFCATTALVAALGLALLFAVLQQVDLYVRLVHATQMAQALCRVPAEIIGVCWAGR